MHSFCLLIILVLQTNCAASPLLRRQRLGMLKGKIQFVWLMAKPYSVKLKVE